MRWVLGPPHLPVVDDPLLIALLLLLLLLSFFYVDPSVLLRSLTLSPRLVIFLLLSSSCPRLRLKYSILLEQSAIMNHFCHVITFPVMRRPSGVVIRNTLVSPTTVDSHDFKDKVQLNWCGKISHSSLECRSADAQTSEAGAEISVPMGIATIWSVALMQPSSVVAMMSDGSNSSVCKPLPPGYLPIPPHSNPSAPPDMTAWWAN